MEYSELVETYEKLESVSSKLKKTEIISELLKKIPSNDLQKVILLMMGRVFPIYSEHELGIAGQMMIKAIAKSTGLKTEEVENKFKKTGDLGLTAEQCIQSKKQQILIKRKLTVDFVFEHLQKLPFVSGEGSQEKKLGLISEILSSAKPREARYITRTILEELRVGAAEGIIRDAIVQAFLLKHGEEKEKAKFAEAVDYAWNILSDFGEVALIAKEKGVVGLKRVKVEIGKPVQVMLGLAAENIEDVVNEFGKIAAEKKYDGARVMIHKKGEKIWIFTRRLEDITKQFPDIVNFARKGLKPSECIVEGEALGIDKRTGYPIPFQMLSQRIHRKYDIEQIMKEIPVQVDLFDVTYVDGKMLFDVPFKDRRKQLEKIVRTIPNKFQLADQIVSDNVKELERFYKKALDDKQEGLFLKVLSSPYIFGRHVSGWYKIKPVMETLDLVVIGANWGEGARAKWITSYEIACRDLETGKFLSCGMMSTGLTEEQYKQMTEILKKLTISEKGKNIVVKPRAVLEVAYQEIQKSPTYESGFGLRFPRFVRIRYDKGPDEADTLERVRSLYESQGKVG